MRITTRQFKTALSFTFVIAHFLILFLLWRARSNGFQFNEFIAAIGTVGPMTGVYAATGVVYVFQPKAAGQARAVPLPQVVMSALLIVIYVLTIIELIRAKVNAELDYNQWQIVLGLVETFAGALLAIAMTSVFGQLAPAPKSGEPKGAEG